VEYQGRVIYRRLYAMESDISTSVSMTTGLQAALDLAAKSIPVFPCKADKTPATPHGFKDATTDPEQIRAWWERNPAYLIGMPTGATSGIDVIDEDPRNGGNLDDLGDLSLDVVARTRSGGRHVFMKHRPGNRGGVLREGLDLKSTGGYVILWALSNEGEWLSGDLNSDLPPLPDHIRKRGYMLRDAGINTVEVRGGTEEGSRNDSIFRAVSSYRARNRSVEDALDLAKEAARNSTPPYPEDDAEGMVYRVYEAYPPGDYPEPTDAITDMAAQKFAHTDMGNADRFGHLHGEDYRYVPAWHKFVIWDGRRWVLDERGVMGKWAEDTVKAMYAEVGQLDDKGDRTKLAAHAKSSESVSKRRAMIDTLKNRRTAVPEDFDSDPWLFNCPNGTLDLKTGELREHRREDLITKLSPVAYEPDAFAPTFETRLREIMPSEALRRFVQRLLGYSLNGTTEEHALPIFYGTGANMKSTLLNLILDVTGDYGMQAGDDLLMVKHNAHPTEKADLFGKRFVVNQETQEGRRMNESAVKQMTGGDRIRARRMREDLWEFNPTHTLFLATNHKPVIQGTDHGIWRRLKLVPFDVTIPEENQDKGLPRKLRDEMPGVLAWLVRGHMDWFEHGLSEPQEVKDATGGYREEMDTLAAFLDECCARGESVGKGVLYNAYQEWCKNSGERPVRKNEFGTRMEEKGYEDGRDTTGSVRVWLGIELVPGPSLTVSDASDAPDADSGIAAKNLGSRVVNPKSVSEASDVSENLSNTSTVEAPTERERENVLMMCQLLMRRWPQEVGYYEDGQGRLLTQFRDDAEYWAYRLEDDGLGTYPEAVVASALQTLRARGEL
jgi:putative DNA primase/helicase